MANLSGTRSSFPNSIDDILELYTLPAAQKTNALRYQTLIMKTSLTTEEATELTNLTNTLQNYIIDVEKWNKFGDILINMQNHYLNETVGFVEAKQLEVEQYIAQKEAEFNATLDRFVYRGIYSNTTTYAEWNVVTYNSETYISIVSNNLNHRPSSSPTYWAKIAAQGEQGIPGIGLSFVGNYNSATTYQIQDAVNFNDAIYYCVQLGTDKTPSTNPAFWQLFMESTKITVSSIKPTGGWWFEEIV